MMTLLQKYRAATTFDEQIAIALAIANRAISKASRTTAAAPSTAPLKLPTTPPMVAKLAPSIARLPTSPPALMTAPQIFTDPTDTALVAKIAKLSASSELNALLRS